MKKSAQSLHGPHPVAKRKRPAVCFFLILFSLLILPYAAFNQTLDDFRESSGYSKGIELIPFKALKAQASTLAEDVDLYKTKVSHYNAEDMGTQKINLLKKIKDVNERIKTEEDMAKKYPGTTPDKKRIDKLLAERAPHDTKLKKLNQDIEEAHDAFEKLYNARSGLRQKFDDALEALDATADHPEKYLGKSPSPADVTKLKKYIEIIVRNIKSEEPEHKKQEEGVRNTKEKLEEIMSMS